MKTPRIVVGSKDVICRPLFTAFWDPGLRGIVLTQERGKPVTPFQSLRQRPEADWLAEELRKAMKPRRERQ